MFHMITLSQCISGYYIKTIQFILAKSNFKHIPKEKTTTMHISYTCTTFNSSICYPPTLSICRNNSHCSLASLETLTTCTTQHTNLKSPNLSRFTPTRSSCSYKHFHNQPINLFPIYIIGGSIVYKLINK